MTNVGGVMVLVLCFIFEPSFVIVSQRVSQLQTQIVLVNIRVGAIT